jgi:flagellar protein FlbD
MDGRTLLINAELLETVEATPDTVVTFTHGKKIVVKETPEEVRERVLAYRRAVLWLSHEEIASG